MRAAATAVLLLLTLLLPPAAARAGPGDDLESARELIERGLAAQAAGEHEEAEACFEQAIRALEAAGFPDDEWTLLRARFHHAVSPHLRAQALAEGRERRELLETAERRLDDLLWLAEDSLIGAFSYLEIGLVRRDRGDPDGALEMLRVAAAYPVPEDDAEPWRELVLTALWRIGETGNASGREAEVLPDLAAIAERVPDAWRRLHGQLALLERARALAATGDPGGALGTAARVGEEAEALGDGASWAPATAARANDLLRELVARGDVEATAPRVLYQAGLGEMARRRWPEAIRVFQRAIVAASTREEAERYAAPAWLRAGHCYYRSEKFLEAFVAYGVAMRRFPGLRAADGSSIPGDAAYWRYRAAASRHAATGDPEDLGLARRARAEFVRRFGEHPRALDLLYYDAADLIADGDAHAAAGRTAEATRTRELALERLSGVGAASPLHAKAVARRAEISFKLGRYADALGAVRELRAFLAEPANAAEDAERRANRAQARAVAGYYAALSHLAEERLPAALEELRDFEKRYPDEASRPFHPHARAERILALLALGRRDEADREALALAVDHPGFARLPEIFRRLGRDFHDSGDLRRAADRYARALRASGDAKAEDWLTVGIWYHRLGAFAEAAEHLEKAVAMKEAAGEDAAGAKLLLAGASLETGAFARAAGLYEELLVPKQGARSRVRELLEMEEHSERELGELSEKTSRVPEVMEGLARALRGTGGLPELRRARTLLAILCRAGEADYTEPWWRRQLLLQGVRLDRGVAARDEVELRAVVERIGKWDRLGVLRRSGREAEFRALAQRAERELIRLR